MNTQTNGAIVQQAKQEETRLDKITEYLERKEIQQRFAKMMGGRGAARYIAEVMITVASSESLQKCELKSIYVSALRAATMRMSVDVSLGQAYLVPYKGKATLIIGYRGLYEMAMRTNKYRWINVGPVYEGETMEQDRLSGEWKAPAGIRTSDKIVGWLAAFLKTNGSSKTHYMSCEEIHEHAKKYSQSYTNDDSPWQKETRKMERKTCLRTMLRLWGEFTPADGDVLQEIEKEVEEVDGQDDFNVLAETLDARDPDPVPPPFRGTKNGVAQLGFDTVNPDPVKPDTLKAWADLLARARAVKVRLPELNLQTVTDEDLGEYMAKEATQYVVDAERQAVSVG